MSESTVLRLELIAAKAKILAEDQKKGKLWPGQLGRGLQEIREQLDLISSDSRADL
jgi:hypothetical protein